MIQQQTLVQYDEATAGCRDIFLKKSRDYGTSWRVLRPVSVVDQIMIKALRIRHIQETAVQKVADNVEEEFKGIVNYGIIALIQEQLPVNDNWELPLEEAERRYDARIRDTRSLMQDKNHDYGEAWRQMSRESFVDLILSKLQRIRQILRHEGKTLISEGTAANFMDIVNYAVFALIQINNQQDTSS